MNLSQGIELEPNQIQAKHVGTFSSAQPCHSVWVNEYITIILLSIEAHYAGLVSPISMRIYPTQLSNVIFFYLRASKPIYLKWAPWEHAQKLTFAELKMRIQVVYTIPTILIKQNRSIYTLTYRKQIENSIKNIQPFSAHPISNQALFSQILRFSNIIWVLIVLGFQAKYHQKQ